jgi:SNF2 family DNA or RNA helicase
MGGRKTGTTASWLRQSPARRTHVVAPKSVHVTHWYNELQRWWPEAVVWIGRGTKALRLHNIDAATQVFDDRPSVYVCTYDAMKADEAELLRAKFDAVVFDEGHKLKGRTTQVAKSANRFAKAQRCLVVTGTPVMNKAEELWQYLHMLFPKDFRSFHAWVDEHFKITYANYRGKMVKQIGDFLPGHEDIVRAQLSGVIIQRELAELFPGEVWIEEPEHIAIDVELSKAERKIYDSLVEHSWAQTEMRKPIIGSNALSVQTKLRQMSSDWGNIDPDLAIGSKITAAVELIPELAREKPVLVLATYRATCNRLAQALSDKGLRVAVWTGEFTNWQVDGMQYFLDGEYDVVVGTIASLAEGVDGLQYRTNTYRYLGLGDYAYFGAGT